MAQPYTDVEAIIVGASWAGIWILNLLKTQGLKVLLVDACDNVGGTWCYTRYPGCRVDTEIPLYELSDPDLWKNWTWSSRFAAREEIQAYLSWAADRLNLRGNMVFQTRVESAHWDDGNRAWRVSTNNRTVYMAKYLVLCTGYTTVPFVPEFKGAESFVNSFHSSTWPEQLDWKNKRIGIIGTGASGLQIIETLAAQAAHLSVFQRTPNLATPMRQQNYSPKQMDEYKTSFYPQMLAKRGSPTGFFATQRRCTFEDSSESREKFYQSLWEKGGLSFWFGNYADLLTSADANTEAYNFWRQKVHQRIHDPAVAEKLAPVHAPHAFGTKRPSLETSYFDAFNSSDVELVNLREDGIKEITSTGVQTAAKFHELDILVYATGFDSLTGSVLAIDIRGADGAPLYEKWDTRAEGNGVSTALGLMTAGFPNMFFPMGPQAPSALGLTPQMAEIQGGWVATCIRALKTREESVIEATILAEEEWKREIDAAAQSTLFSHTASWYMGANIPGRKMQALCYFGGVDKYSELISNVAHGGYPGFVLS